MKRLYKEYEITSGGATIEIKANSLNGYYLVNGSAVTITSGLTFTVDAAAKSAVFRIYILQDITIGVGGGITILDNSITTDIIGGWMYTCVYNGTTWDMFSKQASPSGGFADVPHLSDVALVNYDISVADTTDLIFPTIALAQTYIATLGTQTTDNHWSIFVPSGNCDEDVIALPYMDVQGCVGTVLKSVTSNTAFVSDNVYDTNVMDCGITNLYVAESKTINLARCKIYNLEPVLGAGAGKVLMNDCTVLAGDFSNTESVLNWSNNIFLAIYGNILLSGMTHVINGGQIQSYNPNNISLPDICLNTLISILAITTTRATTIANSTVSATTIAAGANLTLSNTNIGAAAITMATATTLTITASIVTTTPVLEGTAAIVNGSYYDNTDSGLTAETDQAAIDELVNSAVSFKGIKNFAEGVTIPFIIRTAPAATYSVDETNDYNEVIIKSTYSSTETQVITIKTAMMALNTKLIIIDAGDNAAVKNITVATEGAEEIGGAATATMATSSGTLVLISDGTDWFIL